MELLNANIDVISTMNVQHIESLNPLVQRITGVVVRETVPDLVMQRVNEIVLADLLQKPCARVCVAAMFTLWIAPSAL